MLGIDLSLTSAGVALSQGVRVLRGALVINGYPITIGNFQIIVGA